ncbi:MAG: pyridoxal phosphate-dependent aminotransferase [Achromobacter sp.]|nr:pyridoxal phosphate-dependent aminotransferase [Achromobacter sp.]
MVHTIQSHLLAGVPASQSIAAGQRARDLKAAGHDIVAVTVGEPDFATPPEVIEAAFAAARDGQTKYTPVSGTVGLRQAIARKFQQENALVYDPSAEILVGTGAKQVIYDALIATLNPGDEVIIVAPYWVSYPSIARMAGATPVFIEASPEHGLVPTAAQLEAAITPRTRWLMLNYPNNPSGAIASREQYAALAKVLERYPDILVMSDEIYEHIRFDGSAFISFGAITPEMRERTLVVNGVSKAFGMTGWRIGYAGGPRAVIAAMTKLQSHVTGGASAVSQAAAQAALQMDPAILAQRAAIYEQRRDLVCGLLAASPALDVVRPSGAFYVFVRVRDTEVLGGRPVDDFLLDHGVAVIAGEAFGSPGWFRISIATHDADLRAACARILSAFSR